MPAKPPGESMTRGPKVDFTLDWIFSTIWSFASMFTPESA